MAAAIAYIRQHACDPASVGDVVTAVGASRSTLNAHFRAALGSTIHKEIRRGQIAKSRELIATTDLPLKQIATICGFVHVHYMTALFHRHTGWTPAEYRKHAQW